jgi:FKBP-type peptidyl-prolyl cis-trans isomerase FklB
MKRILLVSFLCLSAAAPLFADGTNVLGDEQARASYAFGMNFGYSLKQNDVEVDPDWVARAIKDVQSGGPTLLTQQEMHDTLVKFRNSIIAKQQQQQKELAEKNAKENEVFFAQNKTKPGVVTLPSGLQYKVITEGSGPIPATNELVSVNYRMSLLDGTEFDSSARLGKPAEFLVGGMFPGLSEALERMKIGSKWELFIPPDLAFGSQGRPPRIPPNAGLVIEVELLSINPPAPATPTASSNPPLTSDIIKVPSLEEMKKGAKIEVIKPGDVQKMQSSQTN